MLITVTQEGISITLQEPWELEYTLEFSNYSDMLHGAFVLIWYWKMSFFVLPGARKGNEEESGGTCSKVQQNNITFCP